MSTNLNENIYSELDVKVKRFNPDANIPAYKKVGDSGFDLVSMETAIIEPGETVKIPTGLGFELPTGTEIQIRPRSGISSNTKIRVTLGTDDANYRGEISINVDNIANLLWTFDMDEQQVTTQKSFEVKTLDGKIELVDYLVPVNSIIIHKGERIAQAVLGYVIKANFDESDTLSDSERGENAFGSTGVK